MILQRVEQAEWLSNAYLAVDEIGGTGVLVDSNGVTDPLCERAEREAMVARYAPTAEVMSAVLEGLTGRYGGVEAYLRSTGLGEDDLERLRDRLVAPAGGPR